MSPLLFALLLQDLEPPPEPSPLPPPPPPPMVQPVDPPELDPSSPAEPEPVGGRRDPVYTAQRRPSEGRMLVSAWNVGFQWGISPGVVFSHGDAGFALSLSFGYGIDLDSIIVVPGIRGTALFTDPNVYYGMPAVKVLIPIDRFAPFVEGGAGIGFVDGANGNDGKTGAALMVGGGFEVFFRHVALGAEVSYTTITGTDFHGIGLGPILAIGF